MPESYELVEGGDGGAKACTPKRCGLCVGISCLVFVFLYVVAFVVLGLLARDPVTMINHGWGQPLRREDGTETTPGNVAVYEWWPGCDRGVKSASAFDTCGKDCFDSELPLAMQAFNEKNDFKLVKFPPRKASGVEVAELTAWWLPAGPGSPAVVLLHGMSSSFNAIKVQLPAYFLRSMGISVLLPNLRDHGSSSNTSHGRISWATEYPYDALGAWDYVVEDPDGDLGGERDPSKVGVAGGSLGGLVAASAFGLEERIPGLWLNGAIFDPEVDLMGKNVAKFLGPLAPVLYEPAWWVLETSLGMSLGDLKPGSTMPLAGKKARPVAIIQSPQDSATPQSAVDGYKGVIAESQGRYELKLEWHPEGYCNGDPPGDIHVLESVKWPETYQAKACEFWSPILLGKPCDAKGDSSNSSETVL